MRKIRIIHIHTQAAVFYDILSSDSNAFGSASSEVKPWNFETLDIN
jgi:hypothetical protein